MTTKLILLNVALVSGIGATIWQLNSHWKQASAERQKTLNVAVKPVAVSPVAPLPKPEKPSAAQYAQVAEKDLFASDRNPTVVLEPVKVEPPKPMPPLPVVYGVMGLPSGARAIMAEKSGETSRPIRTGDTIGEFRILALDTQKVKFGWNGKEVDRRIDELVDRNNVQTAANRGPAAPPASPAVASASAPPPAADPNATPAGATPNSDGTYSLTDKDGKKWILTRTPFGMMRVPDTRGR